MAGLTSFLAGVLVLGFLVAGLVFFRFFRQSRDRLFALFGVAFWLMAINRAVLAVLGEGREASTALYLVRLLAFGLILGAILDKNLGPRRQRRRRARLEAEAGREHARADA